MVNWFGIADVADLIAGPNAGAATTVASVSGTDRQLCDDSSISS